MCVCVRACVSIEICVWKDVCIVSPDMVMPWMLHLPLYLYCFASCRIRIRTSFCNCNCISVALWNVSCCVRYFSQVLCCVVWYCAALYCVASHVYYVVWHLYASALGHCSAYAYKHTPCKRADTYAFGRYDDSLSLVCAQTRVFNKTVPSKRITHF